MTQQVDTLILGGGLAGLSAAYHLEQLGQTDYLLVEQENQPGGLCRSIQKQGFTFDYSGHLLHLHTPYGKKLVRSLLKNNLSRVRRNAWIDTHQVRIPFPFQAHLYALPEKLRRHCENGITQTKIPARVHSFKDWCLASFGKGIYEHFFRPYNTKLWGISPDKLTCDWCGSFVPRPTKSELLQSLTHKKQKSWGYNAYFYYPKTGGIGALAKALAKPLQNIRLGARVTQIDLCKKTARVNGKIIRFNRLVNTFPLPHFLQLLSQEPRLQQLSRRLKAASVLVYQVAVRGEGKKFSWLYCPDPQDPFFRVGQQSSFSPNNAPRGCRSFYVELPGTLRPTQTLEKQIWNSLLQKGIITKYDEKIFSFWQKLPTAYALYDFKRTDTVKTILSQLEKRACFCAGRYGKWEYSFMESSLLQGREIAKKLI